MSNTCLDDKDMFFGRMKSGSGICSFLLFSFLFLNTNFACAQTPAAQPSAQTTLSAATGTVQLPTAETIEVSLKDVDGDGLNDAIFENKNVKVIISSRTGSPSSYYLKGDRFEESFFPPVITNMGYSIPTDSMKAFELSFGEGSLSKANYTIDVENANDTTAVIKATANTLTEVNENTADADSIGVTRRFTFTNDGYGFKIENTISNRKEKLITVGNDVKGAFAISYGPGIFMDPFGPNLLLGLRSGGECDSFAKAEGLNDKAASDKSFVGVGVKEAYFSVMIESDQPIQISATNAEARAADENKRAMAVSTVNCVYPKFNLGAKESRTFVNSIYAGPMVYEELQKINRTKIADFGFLNTMMLKTLRFFHSLIPNYGVAIILLTLLVRLILYPLTLKQTKSMAKMQKIQPKLKDIQDRYKNDPQKMNEEVMKLYTKEKVNPLGGCLPLLLQLPIIMALYNTFRIAVELRKAPFLWMSDLSKGDPYLILPIAIAALMYYQQGKTAMDPQQKQAMAFMPMMMFVITWSLPSGLLVYWFASSILGLLQQLQANRYMAKMKEE